jgi:hypothetical protein
MTVTAAIRDDPAYPEGGHALIVVQGVDVPAGPFTLRIEPLDDSVVYLGPKQVSGTSRNGGDGLELAVGPDVVMHLQPWTSVNLSLVGADIHVEVRWPSLRLPAAPSKVRVVRPTKVRTVVEPASTKAASAPPTQPAPAPFSTATPTPVAPVPAATPAPIPAATPAPFPTVTPAPSPAATPVLSMEAPAAPTTTQRTLTRERRGISGRAAAMISIGAFSLGAGSALAGWVLYWGPPWQSPKIVRADTNLPSPYEMLTKLSDRSPAGKLVSQVKADQYIQLGRTANSAAEGDFWSEWATKSMLESRKKGVAATLGDFANDVANSTQEQRLPAARFLWEMAAIAKSCVAMDHIATSLAIDGDPANQAKAEIWRAREKQCRDTDK